MRFRILTYNVHKCIGGLDRRYRPQRIYQTIAYYRPQLVLLQEVDSAARRSNRDHQVDLLGSLLNMPYRVYFPNVKLLRGGQYGNAILSTFPVSDARNIDLTIPPRKRRSVLHARHRLGPVGGARRQTLHVYNLHLGLSAAERKAQLRRFLSSPPFTGSTRHSATILAGDFNDVWGNLGQKLLLPAGFRGLRQPIETFPAYAPVRALDSIYLRGRIEFVRVFRSRLAVARHASDHLPLVADLELTN